jgi:DNA-binding FrmR family transcriptional regulator
MAHTKKEKVKLLNRVNRIRGQFAALAQAIEAEKDCTEVLHILSAVRGGLNSLTAEMLDGHVLHHVLGPRRKTSAEQLKAAEDLLEVIRSYLM